MGTTKNFIKKDWKNKNLTNVFLQDVCLSLSFEKKITKNQQKIQSLRWKTAQTQINPFSIFFYKKHCKGLPTTKTGIERIPQIFAFDRF
jgi:hypothetical protein